MCKRFILIVILIVIGIYGCKKGESSNSIVNASSPQEIVNCFCKWWKHAEYKKMYQTLSSEVKGNLSFEKFKERYISHTKIFGTPQTCFVVDILQNTGHKKLLEIEVKYSNNRIPIMRKNNWCIKEGDFWYIEEGSLTNPQGGIF